MPRYTAHRGPVAIARSAFSLVELVAVMAVIAAMSVVAAASFGTIETRRAGAAATEILAELTHARDRAVAGGTVWWVVFDTANDGYQLLAEDPASPGRANAAIPAGVPVSYAGELGTSRSVGVGLVSAVFDGGTEIGFDRLGRPFATGEIALVTQGRVELSKGYAVTVEPVTGHVRLVVP